MSENGAHEDASRACNGSRRTMQRCDANGGSIVPRTGRSCRLRRRPSGCSLRAGARSARRSPPARRPRPRAAPSIAYSCSSMLSYATLRYAMLCSDMPCNAMPCYGPHPQVLREHVAHRAARRVPAIGEGAQRRASNGGGTAAAAAVLRFGSFSEGTRARRPPPRRRRATGLRRRYMLARCDTRGSGQVTGRAARRVTRSSAGGSGRAGPPAP
jgi:hypothetical protein